MIHPENKIYFDGSHYIAIPHTEGKKRRQKDPEEKVEVIERSKSPPNSISPESAELQKIVPTFFVDEKPEPIMATKSEIFNDIYAEARELPRQHRKEYIIDNMRPYFDTDIDLETYVNEKIINKRKNVLQRKTRFIRKAYMNDFNYFATFTYDSKKLDEQTFRKKLSMCLSTFQKRKGWRYMGVWERAPQTKRLHFHCLLLVPKDTMPGEMITVRDYNTKEKRMQESIQNTYFNDRFGRSDFEEIGTTEYDLSRSLAYIMKYIEKSGEKIVYSRGLPMYMISDINDKDVICHFGIEDKKMILTDEFTCYDYGEELGPFNDKVKKLLRKTSS